MNLARRIFLQFATAAAALPVVSRLATAQNYPSRPVRIIVGQAAGSGSDIAARLLGQWLSERLGQPFLIENRPRAGGENAGPGPGAPGPPRPYDFPGGPGNTVHPHALHKPRFVVSPGICPGRA